MKWLFNSLALLAFFALVGTSASYAAEKKVVISAAPCTANMLSKTLDVDAWQGISAQSLRFDFVRGGAADDQTLVRACESPTALVFLFVAKQSEPFTLTQTTDQENFGVDDGVTVYLWPSGLNGFEYQFSATARGVRYQYSSENQDYEPDWQAVSALSANAYTIRLAIPLAAMRTGPGPWLVQFSRTVKATNSTFVWENQADQTSPDDVRRAGVLALNVVGGQAKEPQLSRLRLGVYGLSSLGQPQGGMTGGLDAAYRITKQSSLVGTVHPDYSNVEADQITIAPTEFARQFYETRPFFTQTANFFNQFSQIGSNGNYSLYTPALPTPLFGIAYEGTSKTVNGALFTSQSAQRQDAAEAFSVSNVPGNLQVALQNVSLSEPMLFDTTGTLGLQLNNRRGAYAYVDGSHEREAGIASDTTGEWVEGGFGLYDKNDFVGGAVRRISPLYSPPDGYVARNDIAGYEVNGSRTFQVGVDTLIRTWSISAAADRYRDENGLLGEADNSLSIGVTTKYLVAATFQVGSSYQTTYLQGFPQYVAPHGMFFNQNGGAIGYRDGTDTATDVSYVGGRFGDGYVTDATLSSNVLVRKRIHLNVTYSAVADRFDAGSVDRQNLVRIGVVEQMSANSSLTVGLRTVSGSPVFASLGTNISMLYHRRVGRNDLFVDFGDPTATDTRSVFLVKLSHYFGLDKGV